MRRSYSERYRSGEREAVWRELGGMGELVQHPSVHEDALEVARETMRRVLANAKELASRLKNEGYEFEYPEQIWVPPPIDTAAKLVRIEREAGVMPLSLRALYEVVGSIDLVGSHENPHQGLCHQPGEVYSDPLETSPIEYVMSELEDWRKERARDGDNEAGPFEAPISADDYHKDNVSGGPEYRIQVGKPSMDGKLMYERHDILFVDYLRLSFAWGGFPGFDRAEAHPPTAILDRLRRGLLEI